MPVRPESTRAPLLAAGLALWFSGCDSRQVVLPSARGLLSAGSVAAADSGSEQTWPQSTPAHADLRKGNGADVVVLGDSWMSNTLQLLGTGGGIVPALIRASGQLYPNYAQQGVMLMQDNFLGSKIPAQWSEALRVNPNIKTVLMTGGGNDLLEVPDVSQACEQDNALCKQSLLQLSQTLDELWRAMADAGVEDILYVRYADDAGILGKVNVPYGMPVPAVCLTGRVRCHAFDTTDLLTHEYMLDGLHPLASANQRIADALYELMSRQGMRR